MKPEEAIKIMQSERLFGDNIKEAHSMAIKALRALTDIRDEIDREATYYEAEVNTDIADGLYKAIEIIDRHIGGEDT